MVASAHALDEIGHCVPSSGRSVEWRTLAPGLLWGPGMRVTDIQRPPGRTAPVVQYSELSGAFGFIYAIGRVVATFPTKDIEKEFQQLLTPDDLKVPSFEERIYRVLSRGENLFLAREMAWVFQIEDVSTYLLQPRSDVELTQFIASLKQDDPTQVQYDTIIGVHEPLPPPGAPDGNLPWVTVNRLFHFTTRHFVDSVPLPDAINTMPDGPAKQQAISTFRALVLAIFESMLQLADNTGDTDDHRALNYVSLNYPDIYAIPWTLGPANPQTPGQPSSLSFVGVDVRRSALSGARTIIDVIFHYTQPSGLNSRFYTSVDTTGQFPFLVTKLQPYFER